MNKVEREIQNLPDIIQFNLRDLNKDCGAAKEAIDTLRLLQNIGGFKFSTRGNRCVAVGQSTGNDFDLIQFILNIQHMMTKRGRTIPHKFQFVFIGQKVVS